MKEGEFEMMQEVECPMCGGDVGVLGSLGHYLVLQCRDCGYEWQVAVDEGAMNDEVEDSQAKGDGAR